MQNGNGTSQSFNLELEHHQSRMEKGARFSASYRRNPCSDLHCPAFGQCRAT
jgi:hypothetical protein